MTEHNWEHVARVLYEAVLQMRQSRGIHVDDVDIILDAMETYEESADITGAVMMWRVNHHKSVTPYYVVTCRQCNTGDIRLPDINSARMWCKTHLCSSPRHRPVVEPAVAGHEE